ncbi:MAG: hypothetical protein M3394_04095 [Actinomycetota bacterium]|nr:hypothetical protein [Actinomycetota bacterium]
MLYAEYMNVLDRVIRATNGGLRNVVQGGSVGPEELAALTGDLKRLGELRWEIEVLGSDEVLPPVQDAHLDVLRRRDALVHAMSSGAAEEAARLVDSDQWQDYFTVMEAFRGDLRRP